MPKPYSAVLALATTLLAAGCGGGDDGCCDPFEQSTVTTIGGDGQAGIVGQELRDPLQVVVTTTGVPSPGITVNWSVTVGGGTLSPTSSVTDAQGVATSSWTLGTTAGAQTATATVTGATGSPAIFSAMATEAAPIPATAAVTVQDNDFLSVRNSTAAPAVDTVAVGGSVTWTWAASTSLSHNITSAGTPSFTGRATVTPPPVPEPYGVNFPAAGTYNYYCSIHGSPTAGMRGRIVVR